MKITDKVKIGGFVYEVKKQQQSFVGASGRALDGEHDYREKTISVAIDGCKEYQNVVFLHEICHAIIEAYVSPDKPDEAYVSPDKPDEAFVEAFSKGLYQVIVDNPDLFESTEKGGVE